ncbi:MAG TPA: zinc-binding dehydrogenase [Candidatus Dormibacteraeota bacterium]|nr:zinc-binding dehydrogenase [Candidatus Dormibacteraeota bacterium]
MTPTTMRAARFDRARRQLTVQDVPVPEPGPGEVLVRVEACGICLSDVHMIEGTMPPPALEQVTPGHEAAGTIAQMGPGVTFWQPGQRVVMAGGKNCGVCRHCATGDYADCSSPQTMGQGYDGAWAEYVVVPFPVLTAVPAGVPIEQAAICADAVATPYNGLIHRGGLRLGEIVGLWGIGGLGVHAVQIARRAGAGLLIAVDPLDAACRRALEQGADHALNPRTVDVREEVMRLTDGEGLDLAVDLAGANSALDQAVSCLARGGRAVVIGMCLEPVRLTEPSVLFGYYNHAVLGHLGYQKRNIDQLLRLVASGRLDLSRSISDVLPLEDVARGVERLSTKEDNPVRLVVKP